MNHREFDMRVNWTKERKTQQHLGRVGRPGECRNLVGRPCDWWGESGPKSIGVCTLANCLQLVRARAVYTNTWRSLLVGSMESTAGNDLFIDPWLFYYALAIEVQGKALYSMRKRFCGVNPELYSYLWMGPNIFFLPFSWYLSLWADQFHVEKYAHLIIRSVFLQFTGAIIDKKNHSTMKRITLKSK